MQVRPPSILRASVRSSSMTGKPARSRRRRVFGKRAGQFAAETGSQFGFNIVRNAGNDFGLHEKQTFLNWADSLDNLAAYLP